MELADLEKLLKARHSIREWQDKPVPENLLVKAVELATWAPNGGNQQSWFFYAITNKDIIGKIADETQATADRIAAWAKGGPHAERAARWRERASFFRTAPAAFAICATQYQSPLELLLTDQVATNPEAREIQKWRKIADTRIQSAASAIAYLLLVLQQMGLGGVWMTGPIQSKGFIEKLLKVPAGRDVIAFIPVGYPADDALRNDRKPVSEVCQIIK